MCGRYTLAAAPELLAEQFGLAQTPAQMAPRYNIAPGQEVPVVRCFGSDDIRRLDLLRWGLVPAWAKDPGVGQRMINARVETLDKKPAFREALHRRRCLIPADGFYEWRARQGRKQPYWVARADRHPFGLAGLWERWRAPDGTTLESCSIITTAASTAMADIHERMPLIIAPEHYRRWLDPARRDAPALLALFGSGDCDTLSAHPVSSAVNNPRHDGPDLIAPRATAN